MTYESTLSDREMTDLVEHLVEGEKIWKDIERTHFTFIFSNNPNEDKPFDVVIVELKKLELSHYDNLKIVPQFETRARRLRNIIITKYRGSGIMVLSNLMRKRNWPYQLILLNYTQQENFIIMKRAL